MAIDISHSLQYLNIGQELLTSPLRDIVDLTRQSQMLEQLATPRRDLEADPVPNRSKADAVLSALCSLRSNVAEIGLKCFCY